MSPLFEPTVTQIAMNMMSHPNIRNIVPSGGKGLLVTLSDGFEFYVRAIPKSEADLEEIAKKAEASAEPDEPDEPPVEIVEKGEKKKASPKKPVDPA